MQGTKYILEEEKERRKREREAAVLKARSRGQNRRGSNSLSSKKNKDDQGTITSSTGSDRNKSNARTSLTKHQIPEVETELSELKDKKLVKILNHHFSRVTREIAEAQREYEAALAEHEENKREYAVARSSSDGSVTSVNASSQISKFEKMMLELNKKKENIKRKEEESKKLYRKYVSRIATYETRQSAHDRMLQKQASPNAAAVAARRTIADTDTSVSEAAKKIYENIDKVGTESTPMCPMVQSHNFAEETVFRKKKHAYEERYDNNMQIPQSMSCLSDPTDDMSHAVSLSEAEVRFISVLRKETNALINDQDSACSSLTLEGKNSVFGVEEINLAGADGDQKQWHAYWSEKHQKEYYYNPASKEVLWNMPDAYDVSYPEKSPPLNDIRSVTTYETEQNFSSNEFTPEDASLSTISVVIRKRRRRKRIIRRVLRATAGAVIVGMAIMYSQTSSIPTTWQEVVNVMDVLIARITATNSTLNDLISPDINEQLVPMDIQVNASSLVSDISFIPEIMDETKTSSSSSSSAVPPKTVEEKKLSENMIITTTSIAPPKTVEERKLSENKIVTTTSIAPPKTVEKINLYKNKIATTTSTEPPKKVEQTKFYESNITTTSSDLLAAVTEPLNLDVAADKPLNSDVAVIKPLNSDVAVNKPLNSDVAVNKPLNSENTIPASLKSQKRVLCVIPFAYFFLKRCRQQKKEGAVLDVKTLTDWMMQ